MSESGNSSLLPPDQPSDKRGRGFWRMLPGLALWGAIGFSAAYFGLDMAGVGSLGGILVFFTVLLLSLWLHTLIHEAGHALAGASRGMRLVVAGVGPLRLVRGSGGLRLQWVGNVPGVSGFAAMYHPQAQSTPRADYIWFALGGPLANLLAAGMFALVLYVVPDSGWLVSLLLTYFIGAGLLLGLVNLVPFRVAGWRTDGLTIVQLWRKHPGAVAALRLNQLVSLSMAGIRPRDWPQDQVPEPPNDAIEPEHRHGIHLFRMEWALDAGSKAVADECAKQLADKLWELPDGQRQGAAVLVALHAAWNLEDRDLIEAWLPHTEGGLIKQECASLVLKAESRRLAGDYAGMEEAVDRAREALGNVLDEASRDQFRERLDQLVGHGVN